MSKPLSETKMSIEEIEEIINEDVASMRYCNRAGELVTIRAFLRRVQERMAELEKERDNQRLNYLELMWHEDMMTSDSPEYREMMQLKEANNEREEGNY